jgi:hypothetical protein
MREEMVLALLSTSRAVRPSLTDPNSAVERAKLAIGLKVVQPRARFVDEAYIVALISSRCQPISFLEKMREGSVRNRAVLTVAIETLVRS